MKRSLQLATTVTIVGTPFTPSIEPGGATSHCILEPSTVAIAGTPFTPPIEPGGSTSIPMIPTSNVSLSHWVVHSVKFGINFWHAMPEKSRVWPCSRRPYLPSRHTQMSSFRFSIWLGCTKRRHYISRRRVEGKVEGYIVLGGNCETITVSCPDSVLVDHNPLTVTRVFSFCIDHSRGHEDRFYSI